MNNMKKKITTKLSLRKRTIVNMTSVKGGTGAGYTYGSCNEIFCTTYANATCEPGCEPYNTGGCPPGSALCNSNATGCGPYATYEILSCYFVC
jgi:hypothetical protein